MIYANYTDFTGSEHMTDRRDYGGFLGDTKVNRTADYATSFIIPGTVDRIFSIHTNSLEILTRAWIGIKSIVGQDVRLIDLNDSNYILDAIAAGRLDQDYEPIRLDAEDKEFLSDFKRKYNSPALGDSEINIRELIAKIGGK